MKWLRKNSDLIIISILILFSIFGLIKKFDYGVSIEIRNYLAYSVIVGIIALRLFRVQKTKMILGLALIVGSFNALQFTHSNIFVSFRIGELTFLGFQPISFLALVLLVLLDMKGTRTFLSKIIPETSETEIEDDKNRLIEIYKLKFKDYSKNKLQNIIDSPNSFQDAAVIAAKELIDK